MVDAPQPLPGILDGHAPNDSVHLVALREQQLRQIRTVLPGDAGDQCALLHHLDDLPEMGIRPAASLSLPRLRRDADLVDQLAENQVRVEVRFSQGARSSRMPFVVARDVCRTVYRLIESSECHQSLTDGNVA